jgi:ABC-2 type transport system ATP-binding protein
VSWQPPVAETGAVADASAAPAAAVLVARELVKRYHATDPPALDGWSVTVRRGEIFGLLGPNGAGKTTAIAILTTLLAPTAGTATVAGFDVQCQAAQVRQHIGLVPQDVALYPTLTARENLDYFGRLHGLPARERRARVAAVLEAMGLTEHADRRIATCSGGMKRRANLAAGLLAQPALLFLDEPTVGIDTQSRRLIFESLGRLRAAGLTMVYTTHYLEEAEQFCTRVAIMDQGRVIAEGNRAELLAAHPGCRNLEDVFLHLTGRQLRD